MTATAYTVSPLLKAVLDGRSYQVEFSAQGDGPIEAEVDVPGSTTDQEVTIQIDVDKVEFLMILSDQDVTLETNNASTPDDTINLKANRPYLWWKNHYDSFLLTVDVTKVYLTNAGANAAVVSFVGVQDITP